jgi:diguanylate cyclase (GGDEF)-like protein
MRRAARRNSPPGLLARIRAWLDPAPARRPSSLHALSPDVPLLSLLRDNERIWAGFRDIELEMLAAASLAEILNVIRRRLPQRFPAISEATLVWLDADHEITQLINQHGIITHKTLIPLRVWPDHPVLADLRRPWLGVPDATLHKLLFAGFETSVRSVAIAPLWLRGERAGLLLQASEEEGHYAPDAATDLLEHLAAITALSVDNAINRIRLQRDGLTDPLTQIANRRFFERRLREETSLWRRHGGNLSCLMVDIDHFKRINDEHGHAVGDEVLVHAARALNAGLRTSDVLARYGGEEFVLLLPATDARRAGEIAERLRQAIAVRTAGVAVPPITVSIGVATLTDALRTEVTDPESVLLHAADDGLYRAKAGGRNQVKGLSVEEVRRHARPAETAK